jgi:hypothetical protein
VQRRILALMSELSGANLTSPRDLLNAIRERQPRAAAVAAA